MFYRTISLTSLVALVACGGSSSSGPTVVSLSPSGFASDTVTPQTVSEFNLLDQSRIVSNGSENLSLATQDITLGDFNDQDGQLIVTIDGETFKLTVNENDRNELTFEDETNFVLARFVISDFPNAEAVTIFSLLDGNLNASNVVIGLDANPDVIDIRNGSAEFEGGITLATRTGFTDGFGAGRIAMNVDFDDMTLEGDFYVFDDGGDSPETRIPSVAFDIVSTDITGNGFSTTFVYDEEASIDSLEGEIVSTGLTGRFFGTEGTTVGGQIFGEIDNGPDEFPTLIDGAYVASE